MKALSCFLYQKQAISTIGECEHKKGIFTPKQKSRFPEFSMTNDPEKVWPGGIVHYVMDTSLGKLSDYKYTPPSCSIHACLHEASRTHVKNTHKFTD